MSDPRDLERELAGLQADLERARQSIARAFVGHAAVVEELLVALVAGGHALIEGAPGLGKTTLVKALARTLDLSFARIQFTPDLMPADVLGARVLDEDAHGRREFRFERGPIFAHVVLADEINRASPRTQAALLEAMAERQVTAFGATTELAAPFLVVATENPIEMEGTYPLPEAQLDRFLVQCVIRMPDEAGLVAILSRETTPQPTAAILDRARVLRLIELARQVPIESALVARVARTLVATHPDRPSAPETIRRLVRLGASPRAGEAWIAAAKARALIRGRVHVAAEDLDELAPSVLRHRLVLGYEALGGGVTRDELVRAALTAARTAS